MRETRQKNHVIIIIFLATLYIYIYLEFLTGGPWTPKGSVDIRLPGGPRTDLRFSQKMPKIKFMREINTNY